MLDTYNGFNGCVIKFICAINLEVRYDTFNTYPIYKCQDLIWLFYNWDDDLTFVTHFNDFLKY